MVKPPFPGAARQSVRVRLDGKDQTLSLGPDAPVGNLVATGSGAGEVVLSSGPGAVARVETTYVPAADGSQAAPRSAGFVVARNLLRVKKGAPPERTALTEPGTTQKLAVGDVVEEHVQVVNPQARHYVAVVVPLAAGMEPLNPRLATAPPEAKPAGSQTLEPTYVAFLDDAVSFYYDSLPAGTYDFYFRTRATTPGSFVQPPAKAEMMYDAAVVGSGAGARIVAERPAE
jgi:uncharacterized protein YfaS (alpha-2-macroglobulin family)